MCSIFANRSKIVGEIMKFSFHHKAFYCYLGMSVWIFFLITVMYKYMSLGEEKPVVKRTVPNEYVSRIDVKYSKIYKRVCNPPDKIVRRSEGLVDNDLWMLHGVLVLTRHGDRGPLTHLRYGEELPCDKDPSSPLYDRYAEYVANASTSGRAWWVSVPGPFHNFPSLPTKTAGSDCALGQLTPRGILQMIKVGNILRDAYGNKFKLNTPETQGKKDTGDVVSYSTRYRRTFQSLVALCWGAWRGAAGARAAGAGEAHSIAFCFRDCACAAHHALNKKLSSQSKIRLDSHPAVKELVKRLSKVLFESQEQTDADVVRDALLAYMCHEVPLPCTEKQESMESGMIHNQADIIYGRRKVRDLGGKYYDSKKTPLDFDAQMEREKLQYYQQRYLDNSDGYEDVVVIKKNLDADFNFPNDARMDADFDEDYKEPTQESAQETCIKKEDVISLFGYLEWSYKQEINNIHNRKRGLLMAYGLIHNIVQNMIKMISDNKPKFVLYSGHDKTLQALILALGLNDHQHYNIQYASRIIFEIYRKKHLTDEFKFSKRKPVAQDFYFRVVYNGEEVTDKLSFCKSQKNMVMNVADPQDDSKFYNIILCSIENIVRFIHDDYFASFNVTNFKDACASYGNTKHIY